jgi:hypothetical protein
LSLALLSAKQYQIVNPVGIGSLNSVPIPEKKGVQGVQGR